MIELTGITRRYGPKIAVDRLSLSVRAGEVFAFLGPNGAGKTTTIKMLVGLLVPDAGRITLDGYDMVQQPRLAKRRLGYVPDQPELYDKLSAREFLQFCAQMHGMSAADSVAAIERQESMFELTNFANQLTEDYSHGMKQRVAFAAALLHDPSVLILDEPMVGLDPRSMRLVKDLLRVRAGRGKTVFMSTHTLAVAEEIADRIGVIDRGRLRFLGTVEELQRCLSRGGSSLEDLFLALTESDAAGEADLPPMPEEVVSPAARDPKLP
jgi:ABC-2 type transport system ATP-binding protein